jgi:hypothetical protein
LHFTRRGSGGAIIGKQCPNDEKPTDRNAKSAGQNGPRIESGPNPLEKGTSAEGPEGNLGIVSEFVGFDADNDLPGKAMEIARRRLFVSFKRQQAAQLFEVIWSWTHTHFK